MPRKPMDYSKTIMYKLVCNDLNIKECYVGHTTDFKTRKYNHKQSVENTNCKDYNYKKSKFIREHGGWENWSMIQIETYECNNLQEAIARERYWYEELHATLNKCVPNGSPKEYYEAHKEHLCKYSKEYSENNGEKIKEYKEKNKEHIKNQNRIYREKNKDIIKEKSKVAYECICGSIIQTKSKLIHLKSIKHCQFLETNSI